MLEVAGIENEIGKPENISARFMKPITLKEMIRLRAVADYHMVY